MLTLQIDNSEIEKILTIGFGGNKEHFFAFVEDAFKKRELLKLYSEDKERFAQTYQKMKNGTMKLYSQEEANKEIDSFLESLWK